MTRLQALAINCLLKAGPQTSSAAVLIGEVADALARHGVDTTEVIRIADRHIPPGVRSDEGADDEWPAIRQKILDSDILVFGTPIWLGHASSLAQRVLDRMDAFLGETDSEGRRELRTRCNGRRSR